MESQLRTECQSLLQRLHQSQRQLNGDITAHLSHRDGSTSTECVSDNNNNRSSNNNNINSKMSSKSEYARNKLLAATARLNSESSSKMRVTDASFGDNMKDKEEYYDKNIENVLLKERHYFPSGLSSKHISVKEPPLTDVAAEDESCTKILSSIDDNDSVISSSRQTATPTVQQRRQLIDRHIVVPTRLNAHELKDLKNQRQLNFSYSQINPENSSHLENTHCSFEENDGKITYQSPPHSQAHKSGALTDDLLGAPTEMEDTLRSYSAVSGNAQAFKDQLEADGNNRKLNSFVRDTTIKPKSLLNSTSYSLHNTSAGRKNGSRVTFNTSRKTPENVPDQRLLGYDWIAALLDNNSELMDQSESFFNELRDFRKAYRDECSNQFYMEGPHTLVDLESESHEVSKESKVEPYIVNERLFAEPLKPGLFDNDDDDELRGRSRSWKKKIPSEYSPRFVRVSIPTCRIQSPHRVRPHRRRSFDASDSCSLADHCLLGWKNAQPSALPTAKSLDLNTAAGIHGGAQKMTLAEAERLAMNHTQTQSRPTARLRMLPLWRKQYRDMSVPTLNSSTGGSQTIKSTTDRLLSSAYSTMYEMERLKEMRKLERSIRDHKEKV